MLGRIFEAMWNQAKNAIEEVKLRRKSSIVDAASNARERLAAAREVYRSKNCHILK